MISNQIRCPRKLADFIHKEIRSCGLTRAAIHRESGIDRAKIQTVWKGRGLSLSMAGRFLIFFASLKASNGEL